MNYVKQKGYTLFELIFVAGFVSSIALAIGIIYIAWHFISKFW